MVDRSQRQPARAMCMLFAWAGALVMLPVLYRTAAAGMLAAPLLRVPILLGLVVAVAVIFRAVFTRTQPAWLSLPMCAVLGALFTAISVSLTMLCAGLFA